MAVVQGTIRDDGGAVFNVRNTAFAGGATGNGSTNDALAIQAAIEAAAANGGTVYFPAGTYKHTLIQLHGRVNMVGAPGAILQCAGLQSHDPAVVEGNTPVAIAVGIAWAGTRFAAHPYSGVIEGLHFTRHPSFSFPDGTHLINFFFASEYGVIRCRFTDMPGATPIKHNNDGTWYNQAEGVAKNKGYFLYNYINAGATNVASIQEGISIFKVNLDVNASDMHVVGNTILNISDDPIAGHGVTGFWVRDNHCRTMDGHIKINDCLDFHVLSNDCEHVQFQGAQGLTWGTGVSLIWAGWGNDMESRGSHLGEIRFNRLRIPDGHAVPYPIYLTGASDVEVTHNHVRNEGTGDAYITARMDARPEVCDYSAGAAACAWGWKPYGRILVDDNYLVRTGITFVESESPQRVGWVRARNNTSLPATRPNGTVLPPLPLRAEAARFAEDDVDPRGWNAPDHQVNGALVAQPELLCEWSLKDIAATSAEVPMVRFDSMGRWYAPADIQLTAVTVECDADFPALGADAKVRVNAAQVIQFTFTNAGASPRLWTHAVPANAGTPAVPGVRVLKNQYVEVGILPQSRLTGRDVVLRLYGVRLARMGT
ncbi:glycosyl hydrolase family 28-related protein [Longimicrobium sp.]|uniref:glycosyl hydrolase family 28-related protein n=1 Tax=Longimicrobium sp. TaxID=2029185 RepID=UPI003B3A0B42